MKPTTFLLLPPLALLTLAFACTSPLKTPNTYTSPTNTSSPSFPWPEGKRAAISLSFDDARLSHPDVGLPLFRELGAKATFYVVPQAVESRLEDWQQIVAEGHEIGNHTIYHPCTGNFAWSREKALENYSLASMRRELLKANAQIKQLLGVEPSSFAYTCGNTFVGRGGETRSYVPLVEELFESGRGWMNEATNDPWFADMAQLQGIEMDGKDFQTDILPRIREALHQGSWLLLAGHEIGEGGEQTVLTNMLRKLVAYANQPNSGIWLAPVGEVAAYVKEKRSEQLGELKKSLTFCATFDEGFEADFAKGDKRIFSAPNYDPQQGGSAGMSNVNVSRAVDKGRFGDALHFRAKGNPTSFYQARGNFPYRETNWNGTISLWLSLDPEEDLAPGYTDPIQITDAGYNDAGIWVDFSNQNPRSFRMGLYGDLTAWNPDDLPPDDNPDFQNRLLPAEYRPFGRDSWTHVVVTFSGLNTGKGTASFYINGRHQGGREITEPFTWEPSKAKIYLGLSYIGLVDEVMLFDRALRGEEVGRLYELPGGAHTLLKSE